jgi:hypothetical protein
MKNVTKDALMKVFEQHQMTAQMLAQDDAEVYADYALTNYNKSEEIKRIRAEQAHDAQTIREQVGKRFSTTINISVTKGKYMLIGYLITVDK